MPQIYEIFPSRNRFLCGCCVAGPSKDIPGMIYIYCCSLSIVIPFCVFVVGQNWNVNPALPIVFLFCIFLMYFFMYLTSCSNPGIIPRRAFLEIQHEKHQKYLVVPSGDNNPSRICSTCHIIRPKRASHCAYCQNCVQIFDHHCGFLGTCIGKRNYRYFMLFITSIFLALCMLIVNMIVFIIQKSTKDVNPTAIIVIVSVVSGVIGIPIICFLIFHIYLTITKKTTRELLKHLQRQDQQYENQWCSVDPPVMDLFDQITDEQAQNIKRRLLQIEKPVVQQTEMVQQQQRPQQNQLNQNPQRV